MKMAPIITSLQKWAETLDTFLVHTGQHYDEAMKAAFFRQLGIPEPNVDLEVGSGSHAVQTAEVMVRFEPVLDRVRPCCIIVVGDVNSTIACSLVAVKKQIPVVHVEAGLRSRDRAMPEEINRILTDQLSDLLFTTERTARKNLLDEGIEDSRIYFVGNVMIDSLLNNLKHASTVQQVFSNHGVGLPAEVESGEYAVLTMHRPSNVDDPVVLRRILDTVKTISDRIPVVFCVHPRTQKMIGEAGMDDFLDLPGILVFPPVPYLEMLGLMKAARMVLTDSGGLQEETTALGVPCVTLRENTERPITVSQGTNTIVGSDPELILACVNDILETGGKAGNVPEHWDGKTSDRIVDVIRNVFLTDTVCA